MQMSSFYNDLLLMSRVLQCRCAGDPNAKTVTVFGCRNGGTMGCGSRGEFACKDAAATGAPLTPITTGDILG